MIGADSVINFLHRYFWLPIIDETVHYNIYNTVVYALIFGIAAIYFGLPFVKKLGLKVDKEFFYALTPFIILGGSTRALKDIGVVDTILLETPLIFFLIFGFTTVSLFIAIKVQSLRGVEYWKTSGLIGLLTLLTTLSFYSISNFDALTIFFISVIAWFVPGYLILRYAKPEYFNYLFAAPIAAHLLDASTTYTGMLFGAEEKHVVASYFIETLGPIGIFVLKGLVIIPVVYYIYENMEGEEKAYYLFLITLLGLAIATRNILSLIA